MEPRDARLRKLNNRGSVLSHRGRKEGVKNNNTGSIFRYKLWTNEIRIPLYRLTENIACIR